VTEAASVSENGATANVQDNRRWLWLLLALYFLTRLPWIFMVPMVEAPDEFSHFWVLRFLLEHGRLPGAQEVFDGGPSAVYGSLPQLGYLPHVVVGWVGNIVAPAVDLSVTSRFGSLLSGLVMLWCSAEFGRRLFGSDKILSFALPLVVVFHPQMVLVNSYANCDSVTASLSALAMLLVCNMFDSGLQTRRSIILGIVLGWLVLTKYTGLAVYPACAVGFALAAWLNQESLKKFLTQAAIAIATTIGASLWWFIRTGSVFPGDYMGTKTMFHTWAVTYKKSLTPDISAWAVMKQKSWWRFTVFSYWGMFGYMTRYLWRPIYWVYIGFMLIATTGGLKALIVWLLGQKGPPPAMSDDRESGLKGESKISKNGLLIKGFEKPATPEQKEHLRKAFTWLMLATCFLSNISMMVYASTKNLGGAQGRYLFPSEIPILALILGGLYLTGSKVRKPLILLLVGFNVIVYIAAFCLLCPIYGFRFLKTY
jgi:hypothetical protein